MHYSRATTLLVYLTLNFQSSKWTELSIFYGDLATNTGRSNENDQSKTAKSFLRERCCSIMKTRCNSWAIEGSCEGVPRKGEEETDYLLWTVPLAHLSISCAKYRTLLHCPRTASERFLNLDFASTIRSRSPNPLACWERSHRGCDN